MLTYASPTDESTDKLPEVVMPACPVQKLLKGQKALVTGANSGIGKAVPDVDQRCVIALRGSPAVAIVQGRQGGGYQPKIIGCLFGIDFPKS